MLDISQEMKYSAAYATKLHSSPVQRPRYIAVSKQGMIGCAYQLECLPMRHIFVLLIMLSRFRPLAFSPISSFGFTCAAAPL